MPQSMANYDAALKDNYGPGLRESVNNKNAVYSQLSVNDEDIQGRQAVWTVHTGRSTSVGARGELAALPSADRQRYQQVRDNLSMLYVTIKVSGPAQHLTKGDEGAFTKALESELKGAEKDLSNDVARQSFNQVVTISGTRYLGALAYVASVSTNTLTLNDPANVAAISGAELRYFFKNELVDVINGTTAVSRGTSSISSISTANGTITLAAAPAGTATGDYVARQGNWLAAETLGGELNGLRYLIDATTVYANLDPATEPQWAANTIGSTTTLVTEVLFDQANEKVQTDGDGGEVNLWIAEHSQRRKLAQQLQAQKRYDGNEETLRAGWKGLKLTYGTLVVDRFCPTGTIFGLNTAEIARFMGYDFTWDEDDGRVLIRALDGSDAVEARYKSYQNIEATNRNSHIKVTASVPTF